MSAEATSQRRYVTVPDAAAYAACDPATIRRRIKAGKLTSYKLGNDHRIDLTELDRLLELEGRSSTSAVARPR